MHLKLFLLSKLAVLAILLSFYPSICFCVICLISASVHSHLSMFVMVYLLIGSVCPSIHPSVCLYIFPYVNPSVCLSVFLNFSLNCLYSWLLRYICNVHIVCLFQSMNVCLQFYMSVRYILSSYLKYNIPIKSRHFAGLFKIHRFEKDHFSQLNSMSILFKHI